MNDNDAHRNITLVASNINDGITRNDSIYDLVLATVTVTGNASEVKGSDITDTRLDSTRCGAVTSAIKSVQSLDLFTQVTELFKEIKAQNESEMNANRTEFNDWFETVKDTLDSDTAGKLSNRISDVENMIMENHFTTTLLTEDGELVDENGHEILSDWTYKVESGDVKEECGNLDSQIEHNILEAKTSAKNAQISESNDKKALDDTKEFANQAKSEMNQIKTDTNTLKDEANTSAVNAKASETKAKEYADNLQSSTDDISQLKEDLDELAEFDITDFSMVSGVFILSVSGEESDNDNSDATDFIYVKPNQRIKVYGAYLDGNRSIYAYDTRMQSIASVIDHSTSSNVEITTPEHCAYIRVTTRHGVTPIIRIIDNPTINDRVLFCDRDFPIEIVENVYIDSSGEEVASASTDATDYIHVVSGYNITIEKAYVTNYTIVYFYDELKRAIGRKHNKENGVLLDSYSFDVPSNCHYIRFSRIAPTDRPSEKLSNRIRAYYTSTIPTKAELTDSEKTVTIWKSLMGMKLDNLLQVAGKKSILSICDDDTTYDAIPSLKTICDTKGVKCSFACIAAKLTNGEYAENLTNRLLEYQSEGFHIANHSYSHGDFWKTDSDLFNISECESDLIMAMQIFREKGFIDSDYLVTPFGGSEQPLQNLARKYGFNCLIDSADTKMNHYGQNGRYKVRRILIAPTQDLNYYKELIDTAVANGDWLVLETHTSMSSQWDATLVENIIDYALTKNIDIMPLNEAFQTRKICYDFYDLFKVVM